ncbi:MAG: nucleotidyltransferase domain-containing protein [Nanoarchaeota archaeon]|nr:nucleotidyltransferase domain-containing protein [Nanoarchaeota archaeon]
MIKPKGNKKEQMLYIETGMQRVLEILFIYPDKEFSLSDLAKEAGVAKANIGDMLDKFIEMNLIEITKLKKIWRIRAKRESWDFVKNKIVYNLDLIYKTDLLEFLNNHYQNPKSIILFGSFRRGEDISDSDIDIAVETDIGEYRIETLKELHNLEKDIKRKISIHLFSRGNIDLNLFNNIANGIVLSGFLEVKK